MQNADKFLAILKEYLGSKLSKLQRAQMSEYLHLLGKWNSVYNLTAITKPREMVIRHIVDSLSIVQYLQGSRIIDVGTGAGLPGIPLAVIKPDKYFELLDSKGKKTRFLVQVVAALGLNNVEVVNQRAERYVPSKCFDTVITRAFSSIHDMLRLTEHLACKEGVFLAMKGKQPTEELEILPKDWIIEFVAALDVPGLDAERHLVGIKHRVDTESK